MKVPLYSIETVVLLYELSACSQIPGKISSGRRLGSSPTASVLITPCLAKNGFAFSHKHCNIIEIITHSHLKVADDKVPPVYFEKCSKCL